MYTNVYTTNLDYIEYPKKSRALASLGDSALSRRDNASTNEDSIQAPVRQRAFRAPSLEGCVAHVAPPYRFFYDVSNRLWERISKSAWENKKRKRREV